MNMYIIHIPLPAMLYYCQFSETTTQGTVCSKGLPLMAVRALCGVLSMRMRFIRVSSDMVGHYLGEEKKEIEEMANLRS